MRQLFSTDRGAIWGPAQAWMGLWARFIDDITCVVAQNQFPARQSSEAVKVAEGIVKRSL